jgi:hypothetical protein
MTPEEQMLSDVLARSLSLCDTIAYLISREAERSADVDAVFLSSPRRLMRDSMSCRPALAV